MNKCVKGYLRFFAYDKQTQWVKWFPLAEWWYNTSFHTTTKMTPFMALYGYHTPSITSFSRENSKVQEVEDHIEHQEQVLGVAKDWYYGIQIGASCSFSIAPSFPCFMFKKGYRRQAPSSNNIAKTWRGRKNYIGTGSSHRNKNSTATKLINFEVSYPVEELICWRFHMGGWEFYTEVSINTQALRTTLFEGEGHVRYLYY